MRCSQVYSSVPCFPACSPLWSRSAERGSTKKSTIANARRDTTARRKLTAAAGDVHRKSPEAVSDTSSAGEGACGRKGEKAGTVDATAATDAARGVNRRDALVSSLLAAAMTPATRVDAAAAIAATPAVIPADVALTCSSCEGVVDDTLGRCEGFAGNACRSTSDDRPPYFAAPW
jgi:hypothetical protein